MPEIIPIKTFNQELLAGIPAGMWVAISEDQERVVGKGLTVVEALEEAKQVGEEHAFVMRVPDANSAMIL